MKKVILVAIVIASVAVVGIVISNQGVVDKLRATNCAVPDNNPYGSLPTVCSSVLEVPASVPISAILHQLLPSDNPYGRVIPQLAPDPDVTVNTGQTR